MKKGFKISLLILMLVVMCTGCDAIHASSNRDIRHSGFAISGSELECKDLYKNNDYDKVKFLTGSHVIMESGVVYSLSISQKYSNDQHCMISPLQEEVVALFDENIVKLKNGKYYYLIRSGENAAYTQVPSKDANYMIYDVILKSNDVIKVKTVDANAGKYYVLKTDGNVYNYVLNKNFSSAKIVSTPVVYSKTNYGGDIRDFNYMGNATGTFVKTDTEYFRMMPTNRDECSKYVDVTCQYEMHLDEGLTKHRNKILGFSGTYLITNYGKQFNATS